jgi:putative ABC transport system permease protein
MVNKLFNKIPLAWLQVTREKTRLAVAIAGIAFADLLIFIQMGFEGALYDSAVKPHRTLQADLVLINPQFQTLFSVKSFSRERLYQALSYEGVNTVSPLYISTGQWQNPETRVSRAILVWGVDPASPAFKFPEVNQNLDQLKLLNQVLFDQAAKTIPVRPIPPLQCTTTFSHSLSASTKNGKIIPVSCSKKSCKFKPCSTKKGTN